MNGSLILVFACIFAGFFISPGLSQSSQLRSDGEICQAFRSEWITSYAPGSGEDVNFTNPVSVATGINHIQGCQAGQVRQSPFLDDALRRLNYYRWLVRLSPASISSVHQSASQECALMMALNNNQASPWYHSSTDPHTQHDGWACQTTSGSQAARWGNIYSGQSLANLDFMWQTTPAHILRGFVDDFSSSKQGHRQNVLCPNLDDVSFGHLCFYDEAITKRYFCGGCQWAYGRNQASMPASGFVSWPPEGAVPDQIVPIHGSFWWSFAAFMNNPSTAPIVRINNQQVSAEMVFPLCLGEGVDGNNSPTGPRLTWLRFKPPDFSVGDILRVQVISGTFFWTYQVQLINCDNVPDPPPVVTPPPTNPPTNQPTNQPTRQPSGFPTDLPTKAPTIGPTEPPTDIPVTPSTTALPTTTVEQNGTIITSTTSTTSTTTVPSTHEAELSVIILSVLLLVCLLALLGLLVWYCCYYRLTDVHGNSWSPRNIPPGTAVFIPMQSLNQPLERDLIGDRGTVLLMDNSDKENDNDNDNDNDSSERNFMRQVQGMLDKNDSEAESLNNATHLRHMKRTMRKHRRYKSR